MTEESSGMRAISGSGPAHCVVEPFIRGFGAGSFQSPDVSAWVDAVFLPVRFLRVRWWIRKEASERRGRLCGTRVDIITQVRNQSKANSTNAKPIIIGSLR